MGARFIVYWPGTLGYQFQGIVDETVMLKRYADLINAACEKDLSASQRLGTSTMRHCLEAKPFEPQAELILPTTDAMLGFIGSGLLTHPEMVGVNTEYLHELMWAALRERPWPAHWLPESCGTSISTTVTGSSTMWTSPWD